MQLSDVANYNMCQLYTCRTSMKFFRLFFIMFTSFVYLEEAIVKLLRRIKIVTFVKLPKLHNDRY